MMTLMLGDESLSRLTIIKYLVVEVQVGYWGLDIWQKKPSLLDVR